MLMKRFAEWQSRQSSDHPWPLFPSLTIPWQGPSYHVQMALTIDPQDKIQELAYQITGTCPERPLYEALAQMLKARSIYEAQTIGWKEFDKFFGEDQDYLAYRNSLARPLLTTAIQLFYQGLANYQGKMSRPPGTSPLVCRCFSVFEQEIIDYVQDHPESTLKTLTGTLLAGGGCTRCSQDLRKYLAAHGKADKKPMKGRAQLALEVYQFFCHWRPSDKMELDILDISPETVIVTPLGLTTEEELGIFDEYLQEHLSLRLTIGQLESVDGPV